MMTQTLAILLDAYRELQAKKMFWIVLILNLLVIAAFAIVGVNDHTTTILWFEPFGEMKSSGGGGAAPIFFYKIIFSTVVVGFWFTWIASLLALISTVSIFPDFLASGSVDLFLAKPIGRLRLFFTKYLAGLLFVTLQVALFTTLSFFVLGLRAHLWEPGLFAAIPLIVLFFSYLFAIAVLVGTWTRSTLAALMLTLLAWFGIWAIDSADTAISSFRNRLELQQAFLDDRIDDLNKQIAKLNPADSSAALTRLESVRDTAVTQRKDADIPSSLITAENVAYGIKTLVPKTRETIALLDRVLFQDQELQDASKHAPTPPTTSPDFPRRRGGQRFEARQAEQLKAARARPIWWILGTSLLFELACLALAARHFKTRDF
jgi:ABC-type transport system involved in multi-copper enzyme maturation permease subunit